MTAAAKKILDEALALSTSEREGLVDALSRSLDPHRLDPEWEAEITRRIQKIESGEAVVHDVRAVLDLLKSKYQG